MESLWTLCSVTWILFYSACLENHLLYQRNAPTWSGKLCLIFTSITCVPYFLKGKKLMDLQLDLFSSLNIYEVHDRMFVGSVIA